MAVHVKMGVSLLLAAFLMPAAAEQSSPVDNDSVFRHIGKMNAPFEDREVVALECQGHHSHDRAFLQAVSPTEVRVTTEVDERSQTIWWRVHHIGGGFFAFRSTTISTAEAWLDGVTDLGLVRLATSGEFTGTAWTLHVTDRGFGLRNEGNAPGPRWLDCGQATKMGLWEMSSGQPGLVHRPSARQAGSGWGTGWAIIRRGSN